jgi:hypothetical protein
LDEAYFEGTLVLEKLARAGKLEEFIDAVDSDDTPKAGSLMKSVGVDPETIEIVLKKMADPFDEH